MKFWLKIIFIELIIFAVIFTIGVFFIQGDLFEFFTPQDFKAFKLINFNKSKSAVNITFDSPVLARGKLKIYNEVDDIVREINIEEIKKGTNELTWDGKDDDGNYLTDGNYRFEVEAELYRIPVFLFGDIKPPGIDDKNIKALYPQTLDQILDFIKEGGYAPVTASEAFSYLSEEALTPAKPVCLVFAGGYKGFFNEGAGLLKNYDHKFTLFLPATQIGNKQELMTWEEVRAVSQLGLAEFGIEGDYKKIDLQKELVEKNLSFSVEGFFWGDSKLKPAKLDAVRQKGIKYQLIADPDGINKIGQEDILYAYPILKTTDFKEIEKRLNNIVEKKIIFKGVLTRKQ